MDIDYDIDYYNILHVSSDASNKDIKKSYYKLAQKLHPDKNSGIDDSEFKKINDAYEVLGDKEKRAMYDSVRNMRSGTNMFSDIGGIGIHTHMPQGMKPMGRTIKRPRPLQVIVDITIEDIYNCVKKYIPINKIIPCVTCEGSKIDKVKYMESSHDYICAKCRGSGVINMTHIVHHARIDIPMECPQCKGERIMVQPEIQCSDCLGKGIKRINDTFEQEITPQLKHGIGIKVNNFGHQLSLDTAPGSLILIINQLEHPQFRRSQNGNDLLMIQKISLYYALGCNKREPLIIKTLSNQLLEINIPQEIIIKPGDVKEILNEGINNGNLYIVFDVIFPDAIDEQQKSLLKKALISFDKKQPQISNNHKNKHIEYTTLKSVKMKDIYSEFPTNKPITTIDNDVDNEQDNPNECPIM